MAWNNLGVALHESGRVDEAIAAHLRNRDLCRELGDREGEAMALNNLRRSCATPPPRPGDRPGPEAMHWQRKARSTRRWKRTTLENLGIETHRPAEARAQYLQAADAYTRANAPEEAARARAAAAALTAPAAPTGTPAPAVPPARTADSARPFPRPPGAPGSGVR
ncbi:tetratricopeptide repeat protein [Streptomyces olivaceoviridis]|uniref:tetratricopeptide repeat protein n=1 Tax=Streptomyces olivaceoviridis TaxID=1921 RepID=UPI00368BC88D